ncbi:PEP/pyruvate-binding domain-containing protein, partial [Armatimonas sp.]|uniref:PEP/pyruvate-binding domain-containing protein n=1 Tax=Armatimonas sp. TaxID=1872638 RepID=UPI00286A613C
MPTVCWFKELSLGDTELVGGKGANLGELTRAGIPVPPGFVVTAEAFRAFLDATGLRETIFPALAGLDVDDSTTLLATSEKLRAAVLAATVPPELREAICAGYAQLDAGDAFAAVRSSATVEDMPGTSFAGMNETYLNVRGPEALLDAVQRCWASLYGARVIFYRRQQNIPEEAIAIAVVVQQMADSDASGVMFTVNPASGDPNTIVVEGAFGLGETVVSGSVSPDHWEIAKDTLKLTDERLAIKHIRMDRVPDGSNLTRPLTDDEGRRACLNHAQVAEVATLGKQIEEHYGSPQDIEWSVVGET